MRRDLTWFTERTKALWDATPGRSLLLVVPHGTGDVVTGIVDWTSANFRPPAPFEGHQPLVVRITPDGVTSSAHFVDRIARQLSRRLGRKLDVDVDDYPSDVLEGAVEAALAADGYPVLLIERFHSFARIADNALSSVLSALRTLEHSSSTTTLAISPIGYDAMRRRMDPNSAFVNSAYGDNHDRAIISPLSRPDFVEAARRRGIDAATANRLYKLGGGPDAVYQTIIDVAVEGEAQLIERCVTRLSATIDRFVEQSFVEPSLGVEELLAKLALGCLRPLEEPYLADHMLAPFIARRNPDGRLVASSPIIGRQIIRGSQPGWRVYNDSLEALEAGDSARAASLVSGIEPTAAPLRSFVGLVQLLAAFAEDVECGLLGVDWAKAGRAAGQLLEQDGLPEAVRSWVAGAAAWAKLVQRTARAASGHPRLDGLTVGAADPVTRDVLLFMMASYLDKARALPTAGGKVKAVANLPEAILQSIAAAYCAIDFRKAPDELPDLDYDRYFGQQSNFRRPRPGAKMDLTALLVTVPAIVASTTPEPPEELCDPAMVCSLQQTLVERLRNSAAHTYATYDERDAEFLIGVCDGWLNAWAKIAGQASVRDFPAIRCAPTNERLRSLLYGDPPADDASHEV